MKNITLLFFLIIYHISFGQINKIIHAEYLFNNNNANEINKVNLYIDRNRAFSEMINIDKATNDTIIESDTELKINLKNNDSSIGRQYYVTKEDIVFRDFIYSGRKFVSVIVSEKTPKYQWELKDETRMIGDISCQKSILNFRGRNFIAWYASDIPTPFGPWKFYGLPSLIVRITTNDKSISFNLTKLNLNSNSNAIKIPSIGQKMSFENYLKSNQTMFKEIFDKLQSKMPRGTEVIINKVENNGIEKNFEN